MGATPAAKTSSAGGRWREAKDLFLLIVYGLQPIAFIPYEVADWCFDTRQAAKLPKIELGPSARIPRMPPGRNPSLSVRLGELSPRAKSGV